MGNVKYLFQFNNLNLFLHINIHALSGGSDLSGTDASEGLARLDSLDTSIGGQQLGDGRVRGDGVGGVDIGQGEGGCDTGSAVGSDQDRHLELGNSVRSTGVVDGVRGQELVRGELSDSQTVALVLQSTIIQKEREGQVSYIREIKSKVQAPQRT